MEQPFIAGSMPFGDRSTLSGMVAILGGGPTRGAPDAIVIGAKLGTGKNRVELAHRAGIWELSFPASASRVIVRPQVRSILVKTPKSERAIRFENRAAIKMLASRLRKDEVYSARSYAFFVAVVSKMIELETTSGFRFPILDEVVESREVFRAAALRSDPKKKPGKAGWGGVEVGCFISCMEECEEDAEWWQVWVHAYCLARCAIKCGTGGGPLYPD